MKTTWLLVLAAGTLGLGSSTLFTSWLHVPRSWFVVAHALGAAGLLAAYMRATGATLGVVLVRWRAGIPVGLMAGALLIRGVLAQPASAPPDAAEVAILWLGIVYGTADAVLLNILPVHPIESAVDPSAGWRQVLGRSAAALGASLVVTALYHLGFAEFRGPGLVQPLVGNALITASYLVSRSPLAAILSHVIMHIAAILHGINSTVQLPPHY